MTAQVCFSRRSERDSKLSASLHVAGFLNWWARQDPFRYKTKGNRSYPSGRTNRNANMSPGSSFHFTLSIRDVKETPA